MPSTSFFSVRPFSFLFTSLSWTRERKIGYNRMMTKPSSLAAVLSTFGFAALASAHVVVKPSQVGTAAYQTFDMGVPAEKDLPTVGLKLILPSGLNEVTPNVKNGWQVHVVK